MLTSTTGRAYSMCLLGHTVLNLAYNLSQFIEKND